MIEWWASLEFWKQCVFVVMFIVAVRGTWL